MKVVLFCGGQGLRLREFSETLPKPMVPIGHRPIIWHLMKYYAHYGHRDFILCLGHKSDVIKSYFRNYDETVSNDFVLRDGGRSVQLLNADIQNWSITFVDTGIQASVGERLRAVREHLRGEDWFLANYSDGLSDVPLPSLIEHFKQAGQGRRFLVRATAPDIPRRQDGPRQSRDGLPPCGRVRPLDQRGLLLSEAGNF